MIEQRDGWWWPSEDTDCRHVVERDGPDDIAWVLSHVQGRDCIVQAGGNVGVYPITLAPSFQHVLTCEPDEANYACLWRNVVARDAMGRVDHRRAAFGEEAGHCQVQPTIAHNCGAHRIEEGGEVPVLTIDSFLLTACDAIWLDVEGCELQALKGAKATIERFSPAIITEEKGHGSAFGYLDHEIADWLSVLGYRMHSRRLNDRLYLRDPQ